MNKPPSRPNSQMPSSPTRPGGPKPMGGPAAPGGRSMPGAPGGRPGAPPGGNPNLTPQFSANAQKSVRPPWYKRKYLVYPQFQMTLILLNSLVTVVLFGFTSLLVVRSHIYLENLVRQTRLPAQNIFTEMLTQQLRNLLIYMGVALIVGILVTSISTLLLSHKMAGPMIRLRNYFNTIAKNGDFPETLTFREGDFFRDLPPTINQAFITLKKKWYR